MFRHDRWLSWLAALAVLGICGVLLARETTPGYQPYQEDFRRLVEERFGPERAARVPEGLHQVWLPSAERVDRCVSCHLGVTWTGLEDAELPYSTHPEAPLANHPVERFGCTLCHGGQGPATRLPEAHGWVAHWQDPLLDRQLAEAYDVDPWAFLEIKCNLCHRFEDVTEGAPHVNRGKELIEEKGCRACHVINGRGGNLGPDLTRVGERSPEHYDYSRLTTFPSLLNWQMGHLQNPKSFTADTIMPDFGFNRSDLTRAGRDTLDWVIGQLNSSTGSSWVISVEGHTDPYGSDEYNERPANRRAQTVYNYLTRARGGVPASRISAQQGFGERCLLLDDDHANPQRSKAEHQQNRRVEIWNLNGTQVPTGCRPVGKGSRGTAA